MAIPLVINGQTFEYPVDFDEEWGVSATGWAQAVTNGMLQRAGGSFPLLADVDFGASFGLKSAYFESRATNPATTGTVRLASADAGVAFRNNANSGNLVLTTDSSDNLLYNGHILNGSGSSPVLSIIGTANQVIASSPTGNVTLSLPQSIATTSSPTFLAETLSHSGLILQDTEVTPKTITVSAPTTLSSTWALALPVNSGLSGQVLSTDGSGNTSWINAAGGGTITTGTAGNIPYYPSTGTTLSDTGIAASNVFQANGGVLASGNFNMNSHKVINLAAPTTSGDALSYGNGFSVGGNKITNLANGTASTDAAAFGQIPVFKAPTIQRLTLSSGTYTTPTSPSPLYLRVKLVGAGGGGGGGGSGAGNGTNGSATTFGTSFLSAGGGAGGGLNGSGGAGGSNLAGGITVLNIQGGAGQGSSLNPNSGTGLVGAVGGSTPWGGGARSAEYNAGSGASGQNDTGEGAQGGGLAGSSWTGSGGGGGGYLESVVTSPSATYSYTVGTGGSGGSGGSAGGSGGNGGSGLIVVEEYYQ